MPKWSARSNFITPSAAVGSEVFMNKLQFSVHNDSDAPLIEFAGNLRGAGLIDEYEFKVQPRLAGHGRRY
jgi:hypothetical protein